MFQGIGRLTRRFIGRSAIRARARRQDVSVEDVWADRRLARLGSALRRGRPDPAEGRDPRRLRDDAVRRRRQARRLHHELHVLARAATSHRAWPGFVRISPGPGSRVNLEFTINHRYQHVGCAWLPATAVQPADERQPDAHEQASAKVDRAATTRSSSVAATTAWSTARTSPRSGLRTLILERRHLVGGAAITEELRPASSSPRSRTRSACCAPTSSTSSISSSTASCRC